MYYLDPRELKDLEYLFTEKSPDRDKLLPYLNELGSFFNHWKDKPSKFKNLTNQDMVKLLMDNPSKADIIKNLTKNKAVKVMAKSILSSKEPENKVSFNENEIELFAGAMSSVNADKITNLNFTTKTKTKLLEYIREKKYSSRMFNQFVPQFSQQDIKKYWKQNVYFLSYLTEKDITKDMIDYVANADDIILNSDSYFIQGFFMRTRNLGVWGIENLLKCVERYHFGMEWLEVIPEQYKELANVFHSVIRYGKPIDKLSPVLQTYYELTNDPEMLKEYVKEQLLTSNIELSTKQVK